MSVITGTDQILQTSVVFSPPSTGTLSVWGRADAVNGNRRLLGTSGTWELRISDGDLASDLYQQSPGNIPVSAGQLFHVCVAFEANGTAEVYVDGVLSSVDVTGSGAAGVLSVGTRTGSSEVFLGLLEDLRIYDRKLSLSEAKGIYVGLGSDNIYENLIHRWLLAGEGEGSPVSVERDLVGGLDLTPAQDPVLYGPSVTQKRPRR